MFRHAPAMVTTVPQLPSSFKDTPPKDGLDVAEILDKKRVQINEEIEQFRAKKDKEFQDFERELRRRISPEKRRRDGSSPTKPSTSARKSLLGLLTGGRQASGTTKITETSTEDDSVRNSEMAKNMDNRISPQLLSSDTSEVQSCHGDKPTAAIDHDECVMKPDPTKSASFEVPSTISSPDESLPREYVQALESPDKNSSSSDELSTTSLTSASTSSELGEDSPSSVQSQDHSFPSPVPQRKEQELTNFSTPNYLHLLESKHSSLPRSSSDYLCRVSNPNPEDSLPSNQPSTSLPSAFRRRSSSISRKPKHVLFKLADTAIVEPSSSYEERPSMSSPRNQASPIAERLQKEIDAGFSIETRTKSSTRSEKHDAKPQKEHDAKDGAAEDEMFLLDEDIDPKTTKAPTGDEV